MKELLQTRYSEIDALGLSESDAKKLKEWIRTFTALDPKKNHTQRRDMIVGVMAHRHNEIARKVGYSLMGLAFGRWALPLLLLFISVEMFIVGMIFVLLVLPFGLHWYSSQIESEHKQQYEAEHPMNTYKLKIGKDAYPLKPDKWDSWYEWPEGRKWV